MATVCFSGSCRCVTDRWPQLRCLDSLTALAWRPHFPWAVPSQSSARILRSEHIPGRAGTPRVGNFGLKASHLTKLSRHGAEVYHIASSPPCSLLSFRQVRPASDLGSLMTATQPLPHFPSQLSPYYISCTWQLFLGGLRPTLQRRCWVVGTSLLDSLLSPSLHQSQLKGYG